MSMRIIMPLATAPPQSLAGGAPQHLSFSAPQLLAPNFPTRPLSPAADGAGGAPPEAAASKGAPTRTLRLADSSLCGAASGAEVVLATDPMLGAQTMPVVLARVADGGPMCFDEPYHL